MRQRFVIRLVEEERERPCPDLAKICITHVSLYICMKTLAF